MRIFIGSSSEIESLTLVRDIAAWLGEEAHEPIPWDTPGLFPPGEHTFQVLMGISRHVEAAVWCSVQMIRCGTVEILSRNHVIMFLSNMACSRELSAHRRPLSVDTAES
jgi:hypothetical protein